MTRSRLKRIEEPVGQFREQGYEAVFVREVDGQEHKIYAATAGKQHGYYRQSWAKTMPDQVAADNDRAAKLMVTPLLLEGKTYRLKPPMTEEETAALVEELADKGVIL